MAYKKYITKNGKVYGPYVYHSKRVNGKVVSEYRGPNSKVVKSTRKKPTPKFIPKKEHFPPKRQAPRVERISKLRLFTGIGVFVILVLILGVFFFSPQLTGKSIANFEGAIVADKLTGSFSLILNGGELIPSDSKFIVNNENLTYEFLLKDLFIEETIVGNFFMSGKSLDGSGEGFGLLGKKEVTPEVTFEIMFESVGGSGSGSAEPIDEEPIIEEVQEVNETIEETVVEEPIVEENITSEEPVVEEPVTEEPVVEEELIEDEVVAEVVLEATEEPVVEEPVEAPIEEQPVVEEPVTEEPVVEEPVEEEPVTEEPVGEASPITGNIISNLFSGVGNFFNTILTGRVVDEANIIQGAVVKGQEFTYDIPAGTTAKIVEGSVSTIDKNLSESDLTLTIIDGVLSVTTDYSIIETGFGEDYLTSETKSFMTNSEDNGIVLVEGSLEFLVEFNGSEIVSYNTNILKSEIVEIESGKTVPEVAEEIFNKTNITIESNFVNLSLTEEEKVVLRREFKMIVVNITASNYKDKVLVDFKLGEAVMSNSYDASLSESKIKSLIEKDRIIWLKDLAREFGAESTISERREELDSVYAVI